MRGTATPTNPTSFDKASRYRYVDVHNCWLTQSDGSDDEKYCISPVATQQFSSAVLGKASISWGTPLIAGFPLNCHTPWRSAELRSPGRPACCGQMRVCFKSSWPASGSEVPKHGALWLLNLLTSYLIADAFSTMALDCSLTKNGDVVMGVPPGIAVDCSLRCQGRVEGEWPTAMVDDDWLELCLLLGDGRFQVLEAENGAGWTAGPKLGDVTGITMDAIR